MRQGRVPLIRRRAGKAPPPLGSAIKKKSKDKKKSNCLKLCGANRAAPKNAFSLRAMHFFAPNNLEIFPQTARGAKGRRRDQFAREEGSPAERFRARGDARRLWPSAGRNVASRPPSTPRYPPWGGPPFTVQATMHAPAPTPANLLNSFNQLKNHYFFKNHYFLWQRTGHTKKAARGAILRPDRGFAPSAIRNNGFSKSSPPRLFYRLTGLHGKTIISYGRGRQIASRALWGEIPLPAFWGLSSAIKNNGF